MKLENLGWSPYFERAFRALKRPLAVPGRIGQASRGKLRIFTGGDDPVEAVVAGRLRAEALVAGDWVALDESGARVDALLPRRTCIQRGRPGSSAVHTPQPLAANVDIAFVVSGLDRDFNPRRIERYLVMIRASGARAAVVLNKSDVHPAPWAAVEEVRALDEAMPIVLACARDGSGLDEVENLLAPGETAVLLGSSGAGKSTITNRLLDRDRQRTVEVRASDDRGRHTTTSRELMILPGGRLLIDTPGLREIQLWSPVGAVEEIFSDIGALAEECRFRDCSHQGEPGCAVEAAVASGKLMEDRLASFLKLRRESAFLERKMDPLAAAESRQRDKRLHRQIRKYYSAKDR